MLVEFSKLFFCVVVFITTIETKSLPKYIQKCSLKDPNAFSKCAVEVAMKAIPNIITGDKDYNIQKLNPLKIPLLQLDSNGLNLNLTNQLVTGIETVKFNTIKYDKTAGKFTLDMNFVHIMLEGQYSIGGKILVLPISGNGDGYMDFKQCHLVFTFDLKPGKDGKLKVDNPDLETDFGGATFHMNNLFNGNKQLGDELNKFLNDNWREIIKEFQDLVKKPMNALLKSVAAGILDNLTQSDAFSDS
ncbi:protein takeout-like [Harmonia axyridis]|uniref:protein takeout-like n=1 Tax=Harmonia axyridis TaxID=115357 RepID=UPI001E276256|nr:protein takeout-like [Harmonia axyridis]